MRLVKIFIGLVVFVILLTFFLKNDQSVAVDLLFKRYDQLSVSFVMLGALVLGVIIGYGVALMNV